MSVDLLAGLTAERLVQIAADERNVADQLEAQADAEAAEEPSSLADALREEATVHRQIAAVLRALAGAERAIKNNITCQRILDTWPLDYPTLIAALASVAKQEETT